MPSVKGRRVLVTGAATGLGRQIALRLAAKGARVILWDVNEPELMNTADMVRKAGAVAEPQVVNLADRESIYAAARVALESKQQNGIVWGVINNAGIINSNTFLHSSDDRNELTFRVNSFAQWYTAKAFLPDMIERNEGAFVTVCSIASYFAGPRMVTYASSKAAARVFVETLQMEVCRNAPGVHFGTVCPGHIGDSDLFAGFQRSKLPGAASLKAEDLAKSVVDDSLEGSKGAVITPIAGHIPVVLRNLVPESVWRWYFKRELGPLMDEFDDTHANKVFDKMQATPSKL